MEIYVQSVENPKTESFMRVKSKTSLKKKCDKLWSEIIKSGGSCEICGQPVRDSHHVIGRINLVLRWDLRNGVRLCFQHHTGGNKSAHNDPLWFMEQFKAIRPEDYEYLRIKKNETRTFSIFDYEEILKRLEDTLDEIQNSY